MIGGPGVFLLVAKQLAEPPFTEIEQSLPFVAEAKESFQTTTLPSESIPFIPVTLATSVVTTGAAGVVVVVVVFSVFVPGKQNPVWV